MITFKWLFLIATIIIKLSFCHSTRIDDVLTYKMNLLKGIVTHVNLKFDGEFKIFCFDGEEKAVQKIWKTVYFRLIINDLSVVEIFKGVDENEVFNGYKSKSWLSSFNPWDTNKIKVSAFNKSCIGVEAKESYKIVLDETRIDYWRVLLAGSGFFLFMCAPYLSRNVFFHYSTGIALGLTSSLLLVIFILSRMVPKKTGALSVLFGGSAIVIYFIQYLWKNIQLFLYSHSHYITAYVIVVGIISFAVCYRYGPVTDPRTINLIKWTLQGTGIIAVILSSDWHELGVVLAIFIILAYNFPVCLLIKIKTYWKRKFPPKLKLLSEEEYHEQAYQETKKALEELRTYCNSPECNAWKVIGKIHSDPYRFSQFVQGSSHLSDEEMLCYEESGINDSFEYNTS